MTSPRSLPLLAAALVAVFVYLWGLLHAESQLAVGALLVVVPAVLWAMRRAGLAEPLATAARASPRLLGTGCVLGTLALMVALHDEHFALLLLATVLLYTVVGLGLNLQFGYAGIVNFAGAAFFGIGSYTAATLVTHTAIPHPLVLLIGGLVAAVLGSMLIWRDFVQPSSAPGLRLRN